ncbi:hypothetical protein SESBI_11217 [Sesbania bispinosa]|nr:hypothetical protein SESBI_11217 [Sesbania bispinosa]
MVYGRCVFSDLISKKHGKTQQISAKLSKSVPKKEEEEQIVYPKEEEEEIRQ